MKSSTLVTEIIKKFLPDKNAGSCTSFVLGNKNLHKKEQKLK